MKFNKRIPYQKLVALLVVFSFVLQDLSFAASEIQKTDISAWLSAGSEKIRKADDLKWASGLLSKMPESTAAIEDAWRSGDGRRTMILIQDAHTNPSCQINEAKLLSVVFDRFGENTRIFTEAAKGNVSLAFLREKASQAKRQLIADECVQKGILHGVEYLDLTSDRRFSIEGVEEPSLYYESLRVYRESAGKRADFEKYLNEIESTIAVLKVKLLNPFLLAFLTRYEQARLVDAEIADYIDYLFGQAGALKIDLKAYPALARLQELKKAEAGIDFKAAGEQELRAIRSLPGKDQNELSDLTSASKLSLADSQRGYFLCLSEKLKDSSEFPDLKKYLAYVGRSKEINPNEILKERRELEENILRALTVSSDESKLLDSIRALEFYRKLFYLSLTPEEYERFKISDAGGLKALTGFLNKKLLELNGRYDKAVFLNRDFDGMAALCRKFYELTYIRDQKLLENASAISGAGNATSVLITGGYHTPNLKHLLRKNNISYISVVPRVLHETNVRRYEQILFSQPVSAAGSAAAASFTMNAYTAPNEINNPELTRQIFSLFNASAQTLGAARLAGRIPGVADQAPPKPFWQRWTPFVRAYLFVSRIVWFFRGGRRGQLKRDIESARRKIKDVLDDYAEHIYADESGILQRAEHARFEMEGLKRFAGKSSDDAVKRWDEYQQDIEALTGATALFFSRLSQADQKSGGSSVDYARRLAAILPDLKKIMASQIESMDSQSGYFILTNAVIRRIDGTSLYTGLADYIRMAGGTTTDDLYRKILYAWENKYKILIHTIADSQRGIPFSKEKILEALEQARSRALEYHNRIKSMPAGGPYAAVMQKYLQQESDPWYWVVESLENLNEFAEKRPDLYAGARLAKRTNPDFSLLSVDLNPANHDEYIKKAVVSQDGTVLQPFGHLSVAPIEGTANMIFRYILPDKAEYVFQTPKTNAKLDILDYYMQPHDRRALDLRKEELRVFVIALVRFAASLEAYEELQKSGPRADLPEIIYTPPAESRRKLFEASTIIWQGLRSGRFTGVAAAAANMKEEIQGGKLFFVQKVFPDDSEDINDLMLDYRMTFNKEAVRKMALFMAQAMREVHRTGIVHGDFKIGNLRIKLKNNVPLALSRVIKSDDITGCFVYDFGYSFLENDKAEPGSFSRLVIDIQTETHRYAGTPEYLPDVLDRKRDVLNDVRRDIAAYWHTLARFSGFRPAVSDVIPTASVVEDETEYLLPVLPQALHPYIDFDAQKIRPEGVDDYWGRVIGYLSGEEQTAARPLVRLARIDRLVLFGSWKSISGMLAGRQDAELILKRIASEFSRFIASMKGRSFSIRWKAVFSLRTILKNLPKEKFEEILEGVRYGPKLPGNSIHPLLEAARRAESVSALLDKEDFSMDALLRNIKALEEINQLYEKKISGSRLAGEADRVNQNVLREARRLISGAAAHAISASNYLFEAASFLNEAEMRVLISHNIVITNTGSGDVAGKLSSAPLVSSYLERLDKLYADTRAFTAKLDEEVRLLQDVSRFKQTSEFLKSAVGDLHRIHIGVIPIGMLITMLQKDFASIEGFDSTPFTDGRMRLAEAELDAASNLLFRLQLALMPWSMGFPIDFSDLSGARFADEPGSIFSYDNLIKNTLMMSVLEQMNDGRPVAVVRLSGDKERVEAEFKKAVAALPADQMICISMRINEAQKPIYFHNIVIDRAGVLSEMQPYELQRILESKFAFNTHLFQMSIIEDREEKNIHLRHLSIAKDMRGRGLMRGVFSNREKILKENFNGWTLTCNPIRSNEKIMSSLERFAAPDKEPSGDEKIRLLIKYEALNLISAQAVVGDFLMLKISDNDQTGLSADQAFDRLQIINRLTVREFEPVVLGPDGSGLRVRIAGDDHKIRLRQIGNVLYYDQVYFELSGLPKNNFFAVPVNDVLPVGTPEDAKELGPLGRVVEVDIDKDHTPMHSTDAAIAGLREVSDLIPGRVFIDFGSNTGMLAAFAKGRASRLVLIESFKGILKDLIEENLQTGYDLHENFSEVPADLVQDSVIVSNLTYGFGLNEIETQILDKGYQPAAMVISGGLVSEAELVKQAFAKRDLYRSWTLRTVAAGNFAAIIAINPDLETAVPGARLAGRSGEVLRLTQGENDYFISELGDRLESSNPIVRIGPAHYRVLGRLSSRVFVVRHIQPGSTEEEPTTVIKFIDETIARNLPKNYYMSLMRMKKSPAFELFSRPVRVFPRFGVVELEHVKGKGFAEITEPAMRLEIALRLARSLARIHDNEHAFYRDLDKLNIVVTESGEPRLVDLDEIRFYSKDLNVRGGALSDKYADIYKMAFLIAPKGYHGVDEGDELYSDLFNKPGVDIDFKKLKPYDAKTEGWTPSLSKIVSRALLADPEHHYNSLGELADDLEKMLAGSRLSAPSEKFPRSYFSFLLDENNPDHPLAPVVLELNRRGVATDLMHFGGRDSGVAYPDDVTLIRINKASLSDDVLENLKQYATIERNELGVYILFDRNEIDSLGETQRVLDRWKAIMRLIPAVGPSRIEGEESFTGAEWAAFDSGARLTAADDEVLKKYKEYVAAQQGIVSREGLAAHFGIDAPRLGAILKHAAKTKKKELIPVVVDTEDRRARLLKFVEAAETIGESASVTQYAKEMGFYSEKSKLDRLVPGFDIVKALDDLNHNQRLRNKPQIDIVQQKTLEARQWVIRAIEALNGRASAAEVAAELAKLDHPLSDQAVLGTAHGIPFDLVNYNRALKKQMPVFPLIHERTKDKEDAILSVIEQCAGIAPIVEISLHTGISENAISVGFKNMDWDSINEIRRAKGLFEIHPFYLQRYDGEGRTVQKRDLLSGDLKGLTEGSDMYWMLTNVGRMFKDRKSEAGYRSYRRETLPRLYEVLGPLYRDTDNALEKQKIRIFLRELLVEIIRRAPKPASRGVKYAREHTLNYYYQVEIPRAIIMSRENLLKQSRENFWKNFDRVHSGEYPLMPTIYRVSSFSGARLAGPDELVYPDPDKPGSRRVAVVGMTLSAEPGTTLQAYTTIKDFVDQYDNNSAEKPDILVLGQNELFRHKFPSTQTLDSQSFQWVSRLRDKGFRGPVLVWLSVFRQSSSYTHVADGIEARLKPYSVELVTDKDDYKNNTLILRAFIFGGFNRRPVGPQQLLSRFILSELGQGRKATLESVVSEIDRMGLAVKLDHLEKTNNLVVDGDWIKNASVDRRVMTREFFVKAFSKKDGSKVNILDFGSNGPDFALALCRVLGTDFIGRGYALDLSDKQVIEPSNRTFVVAENSVISDLNAAVKDLADKDINVITMNAPSNGIVTLPLMMHHAAQMRAGAILMRLNHKDWGKTEIYKENVEAFGYKLVAEFKTPPFDYPSTAFTKDADLLVFALQAPGSRLADTPDDIFDWLERAREASRNIEESGVELLSGGDFQQAGALSSLMTDVRGMAELFEGWIERLGDGEMSYTELLEEVHDFRILDRFENLMEIAQDRQIFPHLDSSLRQQWFGDDGYFRLAIESVHHILGNTDGARLAGADHLLNAMGLSEKQIQAQSLAVQQRQIGDLTVKTIQVSKRLHPLSVPRGIEILDNELAPVKNFDLLYHDGRLVAVFPVMNLADIAESLKDAAGQIPNLNKDDALASARYFDLSYYYFDVPGFDSGIPEPAKTDSWKRFGEQWKSDQAAINQYRSQSEQDRPYKEKITKHNYSEAGGYVRPLKTYVYMELDSDGHLAKWASFNPDEYSAELFAKKPGYHQLILRVFPGVYNPATLSSTQTKYSFFSMIFGPELDVREGHLTMDVGSGTATIAWVMWLRSQRPGYAIGLSDIETANILDTAAIAGMPITALTNDNIVTQDGHPLFEKVDRVAWDMPYLSYRKIEPVLGRIRLHQYWDGGEYARQALETFAGNLRQSLNENGRWLIWQEPFYEPSSTAKRPLTSSDAVETAMEKAGAKIEGVKPVIYKTDLIEELLIRSGASLEGSKRVDAFGLSGRLYYGKFGARLASAADSDWSSNISERADDNEILRLLSDAQARKPVPVPQRLLRLAAGRSATVRAAWDLFLKNAYAYSLAGMRGAVYAPFHHSAAIGNLFDSTRVVDLPRSPAGAGKEIKSAEDIVLLFDPPLIEAAKNLNEKGIQTFSSSANQGNYDAKAAKGAAWIAILQEDLSNENQKAAQNFLKKSGQPDDLPFIETESVDGKIVFYLRIPFSDQTNLAELSLKAKNFVAGVFLDQKPGARLAANAGFAAQRLQQILEETPAVLTADGVGNVIDAKAVMAKIDREDQPLRKQLKKEFHDQIKALDFAAFEAAGVKKKYFFTPTYKRRDDVFIFIGTGGKIEGWLQTETEDKKMHFRILATASYGDDRVRGRGQALMDVMFARAKARGVSEVNWFVIPASSERFYKQYLDGKRVTSKIIRGEITEFIVPFAEIDKMAPTPKRAESGEIDKISFLVKVNRSTGKEGEIAIGDDVFLLKRDGRNFDIYVMGKKIASLNPSQYKEVLDRTVVKSVEVSITMSDFKLLLDEFYKKAGSVSPDESRASKEAVIEINLDHFNPGSGFREAVLPVLLEELRYAHRQTYGRKSVYLIKSRDGGLAEQAAADLNRESLMAFTSEKELPNGFQDQNSRIILATASASGLSPGVKRFFMKTLERGDIPNFRSAIRLALALVRLEKLDAAGVQSSHIAEALSLFIHNPNIRLLVDVVSGANSNPDDIDAIALPPIVKLPIDSWIRGARLAAKLILQSA